MCRASHLALFRLKHFKAKVQEQEEQQQLKKRTLVLCKIRKEDSDIYSDDHDPGTTGASASTANTFTAQKLPAVWFASRPQNISKPLIPRKTLQGPPNSVNEDPKFASSHRGKED